MFGLGTPSGTEESYQVRSRLWRRNSADWLVFVWMLRLCLLFLLLSSTPCLYLCRSFRCLFFSSFLSVLHILSLFRPKQGRKKEEVMILFILWRTYFHFMILWIRIKMDWLNSQIGFELFILKCMMAMQEKRKKRRRSCGTQEERTSRSVFVFLFVLFSLFLFFSLLSVHSFVFSCCNEKLIQYSYQFVVFFVCCFSPFGGSPLQTNRKKLKAALVSSEEKTEARRKIREANATGLGQDRSLSNTPQRATAEDEAGGPISSPRSLASPLSPATPRSTRVSSAHQSMQHRKILLSLHPDVESASSSPSSTSASSEEHSSSKEDGDERSGARRHRRLIIICSICLFSLQFLLLVCWR